MVAAMGSRSHAPEDTPTLTDVVECQLVVSAAVASTLAPTV